MKKSGKGVGFKLGLLQLIQTYYNDRFRIRGRLSHALRAGMIFSKWKIN